MSGARAVMRHRCTVQRNTGGRDGHGAKLAANWQPHITAQACHAFYTSGSLEQQPQQTEAIETLTLLLPVGVDVKVSDRIGDITDRLATVLFAGPLAVQGPIIRRADHLQLTLRQVT